MAQVRRLPVDIDAGFPQRFQCRVAGVLLGVEVRYNSEGDFYTIDVYDAEGSPIVLGKTVVYGADLLGGIVDDRLPDVMIVAANTAGAHDSAGKGDFGVDVHLWIMEPVV